MPVAQQQGPVPDRMSQIVNLVRLRIQNAIDDVSFQRSVRDGRVSPEEIRQARQIIGQQTKPPTAPPQQPTNSPLPAEAMRDSRLTHDLLVVGNTIAQAIQKLIGGQVGFLVGQSITSYRVHLMRFQASPESNVKAVESEGTFKGLQNMVSLPNNSSIEVRPSKIIGQPGYIDVIIPREDEEFITFSANLIPTENWSGKPPQTILGKDLYGEDVRLKSFIHTGVIGESGSGKSNWIQQQILIQSYWNSPQYMRFALIDLAKRTFARFDNYSWLYQPPLLEPNQDDFEDFVSNLMDLHHKRTQKFAYCGDILTWNKENPTKPEPIIMIMVEELGRAHSAFGAEAMDEFLVEFAENGRANGFYLTIGMQRPAADSANGVINPRVLDNLQTVIAFRCGLKTAGLIKYPQAQNLRGKGHGRVRVDGNWLDFQSYWMGSDNGDRIVRGLDTWARKKYTGHCYQKPQRMIAKPQAEPDIWEEVAEVAQQQDPKLSDPDYKRYLKYKEMNGAKRPMKDIVLALFPSAPRHKEISGNTLNAYRKQIADLVAKFEK